MKQQILKLVNVPFVLTLMLGLALLIAPRFLTPISHAQEQLDDVGLPTDVLIQPSESEPGIVVNSVMKGSPAAEAGLKRGDIILLINDQTVNFPHELQAKIAEIGNGTATLVVQHGDEPRTLTATIKDGFLGIDFCGNMMVAQTIKFEAFFPILHVEANGPAAQAGLRDGDIITAIDGQAIDETHVLSDVLQTYHPGDKVKVTFERAEKAAQTVSVVLGQHPDDSTKAYLGVRLPQIYVVKLDEDAVNDNNSVWGKAISSTDVIMQPAVNDNNSVWGKAISSTETVEFISSEDCADTACLGELY